MNFGPVKLSEVLTAVESGARPKGGVTGEGDVPSIGGEHISPDGLLNLSAIKRITWPFYRELRSGRVEKLDILVVKDGATTGRVAFVPDDFPYEHAAINEHVFRLQVDPTKASTR